MCISKNQCVMCTYIYIDMCVYACTSTGDVYMCVMHVQALVIYKYTCTNIYIYIYIYKCVCVYVCIDVKQKCVYIYTYIHICI